MKKRYLLLIISLILSFAVFCFSGCQAAEDWLNNLIQSGENSDIKDNTNGGVDIGDTDNNGNSGNQGGSDSPSDSEKEHKISDWRFNAEKHWREDICAWHTDFTLIDEAEHTFDNGVCKVCGYNSTHKHVYEDKQMRFDQNYHFYMVFCECGEYEIQDENPHTFDGYVCTVCGYDKSPGTGYA